MTCVDNITFLGLFTLSPRLFLLRWQSCGLSWPSWSGGETEQVQRSGRGQVKTENWLKILRKNIQNILNIDVKIELYGNIEIKTDWLVENVKEGQCFQRELPGLIYNAFTFFHDFISRDLLESERLRKLYRQLQRQVRCQVVLAQNG